MTSTSDRRRGIEIHAARFRHRSRTVAELIAELEDLPDHERLFASFAQSYDHLPEPQKTMWRFIGALPGPQVVAGTDARVLGTSVREAVRTLDELLHHGLIQRVHFSDSPTLPENYTYAPHDLLRDYARTVAASDMSERRENSRRLLVEYRKRLKPGHDSGDLSWLLVERANELQRETGLGSHAARIIWGEATIARLTSQYRRAGTLFRQALELADSEQDQRRAEALWGIANVARLEGRYRDSRLSIDHAMRLFLPDLRRLRPPRPGGFPPA